MTTPSALMELAAELEHFADCPERVLKLAGQLRTAAAEGGEFVAEVIRGREYLGLGEVSSPELNWIRTVPVGTKLYLAGGSHDSLRSCTICGLTVDLREGHTKPSSDFDMAGRTKPKCIKSANAGHPPTDSGAGRDGEVVAEIAGIDEYGPMLSWHKHWVDVGIGTKLYAKDRP